MLTKEQFCKIMTVFDYSEKLNKIYDNFISSISDGNSIYTGNFPYEEAIIESLSYHFSDNSSAKLWIEQWLYETTNYIYERNENTPILTRKEKIDHKIMQVWNNDGELRINNIEELYDFLVKYCN